MLSKQDDPPDNPFPKEILPGQAYMARSSQDKWPEPYHWLKRYQLSPSSQADQESLTQPSRQLPQSSPHQDPDGSKDSTQPHQSSQAAPGNCGDENPVEDEYLTLNAELLPSTANEEPESSHPVRQRRKAAEQDPWTASLEKTGGVDYYGSAASALTASKPSHSQEASQKQYSGQITAQGPTKAGAKGPSKASGSSRQREKPTLGDVDEGETDDYVFLM